MITEDYVPYEIAKLLKEKGFDEPCYQYYLTTKTLHTTFHDRVHVEEEPFFNSSELNGLYEVSDKTLFEDICSAPTLQMAMKWLREVHKIHISVEMGFDVDNHQYYFFVPSVCRFSDKSGEYETPFGEKEFNTHEEACETAIKYCLENLI